MNFLAPPVSVGSARRAACPSRGVLVRVALSVMLVAGGAGCHREHKPTLSDLRGIDELKTRFNRDTGKPRIVLLVSPT
jgi:hypothetical protein